MKKERPEVRHVAGLAPDYAAPLMALDQVARMDPEGITTKKAVSGNEPYFKGHYPEQPVYPGVFIIEAVNQASRYYAASYYGPVRLSELKSARFLAPVLPGDILECQCTCTENEDHGLLRVSAICRTQDRVVAEVKLTYALEAAP